MEQNNIFFENEKDGNELIRLPLLLRQEAFILSETETIDDFALQKFLAEIYRENTEKYFHYQLTAPLLDPEESLSEKQKTEKKQFFAQFKILLGSYNELAIKFNLVDREENPFDSFLQKILQSDFYQQGQFFYNELKNMLEKVYFLLDKKNPASKKNISKLY